LRLLRTLEVCPITIDLDVSRKINPILLLTQFGEIWYLDIIEDRDYFAAGNCKLEKCPEISDPVVSPIVLSYFSSHVSQVLK
jgi:hypothetical protein